MKELSEKCDHIGMVYDSHCLGCDEEVKIDNLLKRITDLEQQLSTSKREVVGLKRNGGQGKLKPVC